MPFLKFWTEDVALYSNNRAVAKRIDNRVQASIGDQPCVVVAHSLGSIVAYRVLRAMGRIARVKLLITIGSPLGLRTVRDLLSPPARVFPDGVESWINALSPLRFTKD
jgi:alpha-beta hydrolase superfamily lysophospholipase